MNLYRGDVIFQPLRGWLQDTLLRAAVSHHKRRLRVDLSLLYAHAREQAARYFNLDFHAVAEENFSRWAT